TLSRRRFRRSRARLSGSVLFGLPDRFRVEPARAALCDRTTGSGQVGHGDPALTLGGLLGPLFPLSPRTPLLHRGPLLQPATAPLRAAPLLRLDRLEADDVQPALPGLDFRQQSPAHRLASSGIAE